MITPAEAEAIILAQVAPFPLGTCPLAAAHGRVLREDLHADRDLPPFDRVTMDGYALRAAAVARGTARFRIEAVQRAGVPALALGPADDACIEVMTGAMLPTGADAVVPYEQTQRSETHITLTSQSALPVGFSIHRHGSDHRAGEAVVRAGTRLTGREIAVAAAIGAAQLTVAALPRIALVASGDELVDVANSPAPHQIRRSNDHALRAALIAAGQSVVQCFHLPDARRELDPLLEKILGAHDVIVITGGVSRGKFDLLPAALEAQGVSRHFHGVSQRPGKPLWFGTSRRGQPVFALPGNPVSCYTCLHRYVLPALDHASGLISAPERRVALAETVSIAHALTAFVPVKLAGGANAELCATPCATNTSGDFAGLVGTDGFVELPAGPRDFAAGEVVRFHAW